MACATRDFRAERSFENFPLEIIFSYKRPILFGRQHHSKFHLQHLLYQPLIATLPPHSPEMAFFKVVTLIFGVTLCLTATATTAYPSGGDQYFPQLFFGSQTSEQLPSLLDTFLDIFRNPTPAEHSAMEPNCPQLHLKVNCSTALPTQLNLNQSALTTHQNRWLALSRSTNAQANSIQFNKFLPLPIKTYQMDQLNVIRCDIAKWIKMISYAKEWKETCKKQ